MKKKIIDFLKFLFFLGIGLTILYLLYQNLDGKFQEQCKLDGVSPNECVLFDKIIADFKSTNSFWILMVLVAFTISNISRAIRWNMLLRPLGYSPKFINAFFTTMLGYFANLALPRMGEIVKVGAMAQYEKIPIEKVMGTIVVDRTIDVISLLMVIGIALFLEYDKIWGFLSEQMNGQEQSTDGLLGNIYIQLFLALGFIILLLGFLFRKRIMNSNLFIKGKNLLLGFWEGIKSVGQLKRPWLFIFHSITIWLMYYLMTYFCMLSFAPTASLGLTAALLAFVFGAFGIVIPSPGGMGTYHILVVAALSFYAVDQFDAFSYANINFFSIMIGCNVLLGLLALLLLPTLNKNYIPTPRQE